MLDALDRQFELFLVLRALYCLEARLGQGKQVAEKEGGEGWGEVLQG